MLFIFFVNLFFICEEEVIIIGNETCFLKRASHEKVKAKNVFG